MPSQPQMISTQNLSAHLKKFNLNHEVVINDPEMNIVGIGSYESLQENYLGYFMGKSLPREIQLDNRTLVVNSNFERSAYSKTNLIVCENPKSAFYILAQLFKKSTYKPGIHPNVVIGENVKIGAQTYIGPNVIIENDVEIGENVVILGNNYIYSNTRIGNNVTVESNSSIGATGVFWTWDENGNSWDLPQLGGVTIEDHCFIGTDVTIVRAAFQNNNTRIGKYARIAHGSKIGHDTQLGEHVHLANNVSIGGGANLGDRTFAGSGVVIRAAIKIASDTILGAGCVVVKNITDKEQTYVGNPAKRIELKSKPSGMHAPLYKVIKSKK